MGVQALIVYCHSAGGSLRPFDCMTVAEYKAMDVNNYIITEKGITHHGKRKRYIRRTRCYCPTYYYLFAVPSVRLCYEDVYSICQDLNDDFLERIDPDDIHGATTYFQMVDSYDMRIAHIEKVYPCYS